VRDLTHICYEGGQNHFVHGWVLEQRSWVRLRYHPVGFTSVVSHDFQLSSGCCVLQGRLLSTKMPPNGTTYAFRDEDPQNSGNGPFISGEEAGMITVMDPAEP
jgi:hypothetical protein